MSLAALQRDFRAWLAQADTGAAARFAEDGAPGLSVYQNNYRAQLMDCLAESFPHTLSWLGETAFQSVAATHIDNCPPASWSLDHYAARFPPALAARFPEDPEVAELAALEQALADSFVAADARPLTATDLSAVDWDAATLRLVPSAMLLAMRSNAAAIWTALDTGEPPPPADSAPAATLLVWRQDFTCCFRPLDADEAALMTGLIEGRAFGDLCVDLVAAHGEEAGLARAGELLARWAGEACLMLAD